MKAAIEEMKNLLTRAFPEATFAIAAGEDPDGIHLIATIDSEDMDEVMDLYIDRIVELQVHEDLPLFVIPVRPVERNIALLAQRDASAGVFVVP
jgi:hypothetical protein